MAHDHECDQSVPQSAHDDEASGRRAIEWKTEWSDPRVRHSPADVPLLVSYRRDPGDPPATGRTRPAGVRREHRGQGAVPTGAGLARSPERHRTDVVADELAMPPRAGLAVLCRRRETVQIEERTDEAGRVFV